MPWGEEKLSNFDFVSLRWSLDSRGRVLTYGFWMAGVYLSGSMRIGGVVSIS